MAYIIDKDACISCGACIDACPVNAITFGDDGKAVIDANICISCGTCSAVCPVAAPSDAN